MMQTSLVLLKAKVFVDNNRNVSDLYRCSCGNEVVIRRSSVKSGHTKSCGCIKKSVLQNALRTHGKSRTPIYFLYQSMIQRCCSPNNPSWDNYGGRGITVSESWLVSFEAFYADMGDPPEGLTLDRIDNNKGYSKENCRWASYTVQNYNRRRRARWKK